MFRLLSVCAALAAVAAPARADVISVNFHGGGHALAASDEPGIVPGANWNNVVGGSGTDIALQNDLAAATTARLAFNSSGSYDGFSGTSTPNLATSTLYQGGIFGSDVTPEVSVTVSNIPFASYSVYVYSSADTGATNTLSDTIGGTTYYYASDGNANGAATSLLLTTSTTPGSPTTGPAQYQIFSGLSGSSFTLTTGGSVSGAISNNVFGFQIVADAGAVPEPATLAVFAGLMGAGGLFARRRKCGPLAPTDRYDC